MSSTSVSELRVPADPDYIVVAKHSAAAFASVAGFGIEEIDEIKIAVAQACEKAIDTVCENDPQNPGGGELRLVFKLEGQRLEVGVRSLCGRTGEAAVEERRRTIRAANAARGEQFASDLALRVMG